jgi:predicted permease
MSALIDVILPVFLVIGFGYVVTWRGLFSESGVDALMRFTQNFAIPVLLFRAISTLDLGANFDPALLASFYTGAVAGFLAGLLGARFLFHRPWPDSVAVGFATLFSNAVLLGLPITERAWGAEALGPNFAIIAVHAPFCYTLGVTAMEFARADGKGVLATLASVLRAMARNPLVIGIGLGAIVNLTGLPIPGALSEAVDLIARAALPVALFGLGGILVRYRPEGDMRLVGWIMAVSLGLHPAVVWLMGTALDLTPDQFRSAVLTAAMAPGVNAYIFANMYGVAKRVAATAVLAATTASILSVWLWLGILG